MGEVADVFNSVATKQQRLAEELDRVALSVGREGKMRDRATIGPASGLWAGSVDALNSLITDLVQPTSEVARVIKAVAEGDLSQKVELEIEGKTVQGEFFRIGSTVNRMVDQLNAFASEVTRVAREVGTEGRLGGQANVQGVSGTWRDLTDSVNAHGDQPDQPGAQHRRRDDGRREGRPVEEDHRRSEGRDPRAEEHDQHDGGPALLLRRRSDARRARSGNGRHAGRPGERAGRRRHVEGSDGQR